MEPTLEDLEEFYHQTHYLHHLKEWFLIVESFCMRATISTSEPDRVREFLLMFYEAMEMVHPEYRRILMEDIVRARVSR